MVFFQAVLLAGYAYAHWIDRLSFRRQFVLHLGTLLLTALALPIAVSTRAMRAIPDATNPVWWLLGTLLLSAGLPFFAVATNGPLLQRWFSRSPHPSAGDPYFLYAASNLGSLIALLGYPCVLEPHLRLGEQSRTWMWGFLLFILLIFGCGLILLWHGRIHDQSEADGGSPRGSGGAVAESAISFRERLRWCVLAFVPSSLMLGVTTYLTTDIASIPLLWVLPLALYLLTFVLAFSRRSERTWQAAARVLPIGMIGLTYVLLSEATQPAWLLIGVHLVLFFLAGLVCHGRLASQRPAARHLTEFYLWISIGGVLGGLFNALLAPMLFNRLLEYPAALVLACWQVPTKRRPGGVAVRDWAMPVAIGLLTFILLASTSLAATWPVQLRLGVALGIPLLACYLTVDQPFRFGLALAAVMLMSSFHPGTHGRLLRVERNFFGLLKVTQDPIGPFYRLVHGNTIHGRQWIDAGRRSEALSYYHCTGPLGQIMEVYRARPATTNVGVVGLGVGSMAAYAGAKENWTFYEINPAVVRIATDTNYFTFLRDCQAGRPTVVLGDARLRLRAAPPHQYGLLILDAFSSDAIPMHLITREALALYLQKLAPGGVLAFHISNRSLELEGVLGDLAADANLVCHAQDEVDPNAKELAQGKDQSHWLVMARERADLGRLTRDSRWLPIRGRLQPQVWSDDFSNILSVFNWN